MRARVYIRIGKSNGKAGFKAIATTRAVEAPINSERQYEAPLPTVAFAVDFDIPDSAFRRAEQVIAQVEIPEEQLDIAANVTPIREGRRS